MSETVWKLYLKHAGQLENWLHTPSCKLRIKTVGQHFINLSSYFTGTNP